MSTQEPFDGNGYTVHRDGPKTNGAGANQQEERFAAEETSKANGSNYEKHKDHYARFPNHSWEDPDLSILDDRRGDCQCFRLMYYRGLVRNGLSSRLMVPVLRPHMLRSLCWGLLPV